MSPSGSRLLAGAVLPIAAMAALLGPVPAAHAGATQVSVMQDDDQLLYGNDLERIRALFEMKYAGVDVVRVTVLWRVLAPRRRHRRFNPREPSTYNTAIWNRYDRLVRDAYAHGIYPLFNITWPGPRWGHARGGNPRLRRTYRPRRREFARFVRAVGLRYSGSYVDENEGRGVLPRVVLWSIGNEPNQGGWLTPQWATRGGGPSARPVPASPRIYRELYYSGRRALTASGHDGDTIMFGELAPVGRPDRGATSPIAPVRFLREMFCLDSSYRPYTGASARLRGCDAKRLKPIRTTTFAYHPYSPDHSPRYRPRDRDEIAMGSIKRLPGLLDRVARTTRLIPEGLRVWLTEFGYETNPPDRYHGVSLRKQAAFINQGEFLAYRQSRVDAFTQFVLRDARPFRRFRRGSRSYWLSYQSGLLNSRGAPKPAFYAYAMPIFPQRVGETVNLWGQLRFLPNHRAPYVAEIQFSQRRRGPWQPVGVVSTNNPYGFFEQAFPIPATGYFRAALRGSDGAVNAASREAFVRKP